MRAITKEEFVSRANVTHKNFYDYSKFLYTNMKSKGIIICPIHGEFSQEASSHLKGCGCKKCSYTSINNLNAIRTKKEKQHFVQKSRLVHGDLYNYDKSIYVDCKTKICISCKQGHSDFWQLPEKHYRGQGCPECAKKKYTGRNVKLTNEEYITKCKIKFEDKFDYSNTNYIGQEYQIKVECKIHGEIICNPYEHYNSLFGCVKCKQLAHTKTTSEFILDSIKIHGDLYDYTKTNYIKSNKNVAIICKKHGMFFQTPNRHLSKQGCPKCKISLGAKTIIDWLDKNKFTYEMEKSFIGCKYKKLLKFDFYIPNLHQLIEFDGKGHYEVIPRSKDPIKNLQNFIDCGINDIIKDTYCIKNNIKLLRIPYWEFKNIDTILSGALG